MGVATETVIVYIENREISELLGGFAIEYGFQPSFALHVNRADDPELVRYLLEESKRLRVDPAVIGLKLLLAGYELTKDAGIPEVWLPGRVGIELMYLGLREKTQGD